MKLRQLALALLCLASAAFALSAMAQVGSQEYNHQQFCERTAVERAAPPRSTIVYLDVRHILSDQVARSQLTRLKTATGPKERRSALNAFREASPWYLQLRAKLEASLLPSESVSVLTLDPALVRVSEVATYCWPGYTKAQEEEIDGRSFFDRAISADPRGDLPTQRSIFFSDIISGLVEHLGAVELTNAGGKEYVRTLSSDEGRLRPSSKAKYVRVILFGSLVEKSDLADVERVGKESIAKTARQAVTALRFNSRGAFFHMYGKASNEDGGKAKDFWAETLGASGGYLMSFGSDLALSGEPVEHLKGIKIDVHLAQGDVRAALMNLAVGESGGLQDSDIVVLNHYRSSLEGRLSCENFSQLCTSDCSIEAEIERPVLFDAASGPKEEIELRGKGASLAGKIGVSGPEGVNLYEAKGHFAECE